MLKCRPALPDSVPRWSSTLGHIWFHRVLQSRPRRTRSRFCLRQASGTGFVGDAAAGECGCGCLGRSAPAAGYLAAACGPKCHFRNTSGPCPCKGSIARTARRPDLPGEKVRRALVRTRGRTASTLDCLSPASHQGTEDDSAAGRTSSG